MRRISTAMGIRDNYMDSEAIRVSRGKVEKNGDGGGGGIRAKKGEGLTVLPSFLENTSS